MRPRKGPRLLATSALAAIGRYNVQTLRSSLPSHFAATVALQQMSTPAENLTDRRGDGSNPLLDSRHGASSRRPERTSAGGIMRVRVRFISAILVSAFLSAVAIQLPSAQVRGADQAPLFRVRTDVIQLDVSVLDDQGQPVRGLEVGDFSVLKDGRAQSIVAFAAVDVPVWIPGTATWQREIGPDVATNRLDARRAVVIVMDDVNPTPAADPGIPLAKSIANATIDGLGPADLAAVVHVLNRARGQEFTVDRTLLRAAVDRFVPSTDRLPESPYAPSRGSGGLQMPSQLQLPPGACFLKDCVAEALRTVGEVLGAWPGARKTVVLVSPGRQPPGISDRLAEADERARMFAALQAANVTVYQFDPHGLQTVVQKLTDFGTFAESTGGLAISNTNAPAGFVPQMFRENSSYYLLGLAAEDTPDGRFHRLQVKVNRSNVRVRARAGYYAPTTRRPAKSERMSALEHALSGGLPAGDLPVSATVAPFATTGRPGAALAVVARLDHGPDLPGETVIELLAAAFNNKWKQVASATQRFMLPPAGAGARFSETALRLDVPPGRYEVRVAMRDTANNRTGSVYASVVVPDFTREPLSMSGIAVERRSSGDATFENLAGVVTVRMTTIRLFSADERIAAVSRVYQRRAKTLAPVRVSARVVDGQDRAAFTAETTLEPSAFDAERQADYRLELPLTRFTDGEYLLTLDATTGSTSVRRTLRFSMHR
jgi:VWFA-related protein